MIDQPHDGKSLIAQNNKPNNFVVVPCATEDFAAFLAGLLKNPKEIRYSRTSAFKLTASDIEDFDKIIEQRIADQQTYSKLSTKISAYYSNGTSIHCRDLSDFKEHSSIGDYLCNRISMEWTYLVDFPGSQTPQKQEIRVEFSTVYGPKSIKKEEIDIREIESVRFFGDSLIELSVRHTHTTFGHDLANWLKVRIQKTQVKSKARKVFRNEVVRFLWMIPFAVIGATFAGKLSSLFSRYFLSENSDTLSFISNGVLSNSLALTVGITITSMTAFILLGNILGKEISKKPQSYIILNDYHVRRFNETVLSQKTWSIVSLIGSILVFGIGISQSLIASAVFDYLSR